MISVPQHRLFFIVDVWPNRGGAQPNPLVLKNGDDAVFVGREDELAKLRQLIAAPRAAIAVVYGRRRIGKSMLLRTAFTKEDVLFFEGLENRPKSEQLSHFLFQLRYHTGSSAVPASVGSWREAFMTLYETLREKPRHIVFDEFQWMANYRREIVSDLKYVWDQHLSQLGDITLALCGSIASFMITNVIKSNAMYGRTDLTVHLKAFSLRESRAMLVGHGLREVLDAQMIVGGVPKYLELLRDAPSVVLGINALGFQKDGYFTGEYDRIFLSHFGRNPDYERIVEILADNSYGLRRPKLAAVLEMNPGGSLTTLLRNLEVAGFISSNTPFDRGKGTKLLKYFLVDAYLRFYFSFIQPNRRKIEQGLQDELFLKLYQGGAFYAWLGRSFGYVVMNHARRVSELLGFSGIVFTVGPYFQAKSQAGAGGQIDLVFARADSVLSLCEMKHQRSAVGIGIIQEMEQKVELLQSNFPGKTIQRVLITSSAPTRDLEASAYFYRIIRAEELF